MRRIEAHDAPSPFGPWLISVMRSPIALPPSSHGMECAMQTRRRVIQSMTLKDRLTLWARKVRADAEKLRPGPEKDALLKKASQADTAAHLDDWANSPGLQPPR